MIIDHTWFVLPDEIKETSRWMRAIGRLAFPFFCLAIATNVARQPRYHSSGLRYLGGVLFFAILSQWPYASYFRADNLNILFELSLGLVLAQAIHHRTPKLIAAGILVLMIAITYSPILSSGLPGIILPAASLIALQARTMETRIISWALCALLTATANAGISILRLSELAPLDKVIIAVAALAPLLGLMLLQLQIRPLRQVGTWMYPLYPTHLLLLGSVSVAWR
ncbi:TraX family protein [Pseudomonas sp. Q1-7]|uniref:TraX family protein n=1 Tax=Pseudomonas sp. Q1-7 TaxID=3020843 RepID=UPI0023006430|nr:TraX family protein [Pseudomonas sp. Q1-7]